MALRQLVAREVKGFLKNPVFILTVVILLLIYPALGSIMGSTVETVAENLRQPVGVVVEDDTPLVRQLVRMLREYSNNTIRIYNTTVDALKEAGVVIVIPRGFTENVTSGMPVVLKGAVRVEGFSIAATAKVQLLEGIASTMADFLPLAGAGQYNTTLGQRVKIMVDGLVALDSKTLTQTEFNILTSFLSIISMLLSIVIGLNAIYAAEAIVVEKVERAFEMLLAQPIPRRDVVLAKLVGATVALLITGLAYTAGILIMLERSSTGGSIHITIERSSTGGSMATGLYTSQTLLDVVLNVIGLEGILAITITLVLGIVYAGAIGLLVGTLVSDERLARNLSAPLVLMFIGASFALWSLGPKPGIETAVIAGLTITPIPIIAVSSILTGQYMYLATAVATAIATTVTLIGLTIYLFNRDVAVLGVSIPWRRRERE